MRGRGRGSLQADKGLEPHFRDVLRRKGGVVIRIITPSYPFRMKCRSEVRHSTRSRGEGQASCALSWGQQGDSNVALRRGSPHQEGVQAVAGWPPAVGADWQCEQTVV